MEKRERKGRGGEGGWEGIDSGDGKGRKRMGGREKWKRGGK